MIHINPTAFKQKPSRVRFRPCRFDSLSIYRVFLYFNVFFPVESEYDICFLKKINNKKSYLTL